MPENPLSFFLGGIPLQKVMSDVNAAEPISASMESTTIENNIFGALGSVLGYIGAEAATILTFERLLWPQRVYSNLHFPSAPAIALLTPMGGPLHKIGLVAMDTLFQHGLLKGPNQGHMLGTAFFPNQRSTYTMHGDGVTCESHTEPLRNFIWARAISKIDMPPVSIPTVHRTPGQVEKGNPQILRARVIVSHLTVSSATAADRESAMPFVSEDTKTPNPKVFLAIIISELTAIAVAIGVLAAWQTPWAVLWVVPLFIRLVSAALALHREPLISSASSSSSSDPTYNFEIHCQESDGNFMLVSGPSTLVLQFFRHYGHPKRNRPKELAQLVVIVLFICIFPLELLVSIAWMPMKLQYVWLSYQIYVVLAMHVARYSHAGNSTRTEAKIAQAFSEQLCGHCTAGSEKGCSILFGHTRRGDETLRVDLAITYHNRYREGQESLQRLLGGPTVSDTQSNSTPRSGSAPV